MGLKDIIPKIRVIALLTLLLVSIILILQNTQAVVTRLLFIKVSMPLAALLVLTLIIGFAGGVLAAIKFGKSR